jgi:hypothetical protein
MAGWASSYIDLLSRGETVCFRPRGHSMVPRIHSGNLCTVAPIEDHGGLAKGDIVLCKVNGQQYLHLISAISGERYQIANNRGHINGWITRKAIFGKLIAIAP